MFNMSRISDEKKDRIKEEIVRVFFEQYPRRWWTYDISDEMIRDDEFILKLLKELENKGLVVNTKESKGGKIKRKWGLSKLQYEKFKELFN